MENFCDRLYEALENELYEITVTNDPVESQLKKSILLCRKAMAKLKSFILENSFQSLNDEVRSLGRPSLFSTADISTSSAFTILKCSGR